MTATRRLHARLSDRIGSVGERAESISRVVASVEPRTFTAAPDPERISSSVERQTLTMRMSMRRLTRLTNGFSKVGREPAAAIALHYMHYDFARPHRSLGKNVTPAMAAGIRPVSPWIMS